MKNLLLATTLLSALLLTGCSDDVNNLSFPPGGPNPGGGGNPALPPIAVNDNYTVLGRGQLVTTVANGVLANDTPNGGVVVFAQSPTTLGGNVTVNGDGSFTYNAPAVATGNDTFTYRVQNAMGNSTATVTVGILGSGFFVNNQAAAGGNGSQAAPFQTLAQAVGVAGNTNGVQFVIFRGDGTTTGYNTAVTLAGNQTLRGFDPASQPSLTGPINFTSGNRLQDIRIVGAAGTAVNASTATNGTVQGVTIANSTGTGVNVNNATGVFALTNLTLQNAGGDAIADNSSAGDLILTVSGGTFTNTTLSGLFANVTGTANHNVTISASSFLNGRNDEMAAAADTNGTLALVLTNNTVSGGGTARRGVSLVTQGNSNVTGIITGNNITGATLQGVLVNSIGNSTARYRFENNRTLGNQVNNGFQVISGFTASLGAIFNGNVSDFFTLTQGQTATFQVEQLATFGARNTGTLFTGGNVQDAAAGSLGIP